MFKTPFSADFWRQSAKSAAELKVLIVCAMCMAFSIILGYFYIPLSENLTIRFSYLATATASLVAGPIGGVVYGFAVDILDYFMHPTGGFFFGYTLSAMAGAFFYALFLYRQRITVFRIFLCRVCVNYLVNVLMGSLWSNIIYGKGYIYYAAKSLLKNSVMLPIEVVVMTVFFSLLLPALKSSKLIPPEQNTKIKFF